MQTVLITGGTGMIGKALTKHLTDKNYKVIILTRDKNRNNETPAITYATWDVANGTIDKEAISNADFIIHLAGAGVADKRWSAKRKKEIVESRTLSSALIVKGLKEIPNNVKAVISTSATGWYGADDKKVKSKNGFTEDAPADSDFLGETCKLWEESILPVEQLNKRLVILRLGIVFSNKGGALSEFKKPIKAGVASVLGSGKQNISWVHIDDLCRMFIYAIEHDSMKGVYNAVAPNPVTNKELMVRLATKLKGNFYIPLHVPAFLIKLMFGEVSIEVLKSVTVSSEKIRNAGFTFLYPSIEVALDDCL